MGREGLSFRKMKEKRKFISFLRFFLLLIVFLAIFFQLILPFIIENAIADSFAQGLEAEVNADIYAFPAWNLLFGEFDKLNLEASFPDSSYFSGSFLAQWGKNDTLLKKLKAGEGAIKENSPKKMTYIWEEYELIHFLEVNQGFLSDVKLDIKEEIINVKANTELFGGKRKITLALLPQISDNGVLVLKVEKLDIEDRGTRFKNDNMAKRITEALTFELDFLPLDWDIEAENVKIENDKVLLTGIGI